MLSRLTQRSLATLSLITLPLLASAHSGGDAGAHHDHGFVEFVTHFIANLDNLVLLLGAGLVVGLILTLRRAA